MTVVAYNHSMICTDLMLTMGYRTSVSKKMYIANNSKSGAAIVTGSGDLDAIQATARWWEKSQKEDHFPDITEGGGVVLLVTADWVRIYSHRNQQCYEEHSRDTKLCLGTGGEIGYGLLNTGVSPFDTVQICLQRAAGCGGGIHRIDLTGKFNRINLEDNQRFYRLKCDLARVDEVEDANNGLYLTKARKKAA